MICVVGCCALPVDAQGFGSLPLCFIAGLSTHPPVRRNPRVHSWFVEDMPIHKAAFTAGGSKVWAGN